MFRYNFFDYIARAMILLTAMPVHECAHAFASHKLGDDTAARQGRLNLNPFVHLELMGSILLLFTGFGWAKPVQINTRNFANPRRDMAISAAAGPISNILLAFIIMILMKVLILARIFYMPLGSSFVSLLYAMVMINLYLAVFNLLPFPPLDGFKIFGSILPEKFYFWVLEYERYISLALFALILTGILSTPIQLIAGLIFNFLNFITKPLGLI